MSSTTPKLHDELHILLDRNLPSVLFIGNKESSTRPLNYRYSVAKGGVSKEKVLLCIYHNAN